MHVTAEHALSAPATDADAVVRDLRDSTTIFGS